MTDARSTELYEKVEEKYQPCQTESMSTSGDTRIVHDVKTYRAFLVILNRLRKNALQPDLLFRRYLDGCLWMVVIRMAKLVEIIGWDETGMKSELTQTCKHTQSMSRYLEAVVGREVSHSRRTDERKTYGD